MFLTLGVDCPILINLQNRRYAYFKKLDYFSTECIYSPDAYRGHARAFLKDLEAARPSAIIDIIHSGEAFEVREEIKATQKVQRKHTATPFISCPSVQSIWAY
jgi:tRNA(Ile)-lysidine synthase TilS/MesJ